MLFFHVFPPFPAFQLFWGDDRKIQVLLAVLCALAEAFGGALPIPKGMEFSGIMMISDQCLYLYLSISILIYIYIYLYLYIYMFVYIYIYRLYICIIYTLYIYTFAHRYIN